MLMTLPGEASTEFIEILPFTPANRNNLIGWIAGRSDGEHYGQAVVYDFPKTRLIDGPLQIEARIDQNAQLSGQLTLWNQQGSHVRRGSLIVIPIGRALLYAEPIYLQADRSPMPELRLVVLAVQDRLAYGPTFEAAMAALFGGAASTLSAPTAAATAGARSRRQASAATRAGAGQGAKAEDLNALIKDAARDLSDYQQLTAAGKLGEAGQKLEAVEEQTRGAAAPPVMRELTYLGPRRVEWRSVSEPALGGECEALVRPVIAARCDGDNLPSFNSVTTAMRAGVALHYLDPVTTDLLGAQPYRAPFAIGHECIAEVVACGGAVRRARAGQLVIVPWAISCGACRNCGAGLTSRCVEAGNSLLSAYGFGASMGSWGGAVSDLLRVPYADAMLVPVPAAIDPLKLASASDNLPDAWRAVGPPLMHYPQAPVLVVGGAARSIGLYAAGMAVALGAWRMTLITTPNGWRSPSGLAHARSSRGPVRVGSTDMRCASAVTTGSRSRRVPAPPACDTHCARWMPAASVPR